MTTLVQRSPQLESPAPQSRRTWWLLAALVVAIAMVIWLIAFSPVLGVRSVQVRGARTLSAAQIEAAAAVPPGHPLARLSTGAIERRVEALPRIATASVSVSYPSSVVITVTERAAVGYLSVDGVYWLVDKTGRRFASTTKPPRLTRLIAPGSALGSRSTLLALATVATALTPALRKLVTSVSANDPDHITLLLSRGRSAIWGTAERSAQKAMVLAALLHRPGEVFDVSDPGLVVVR